MIVNSNILFQGNFSEKDVVCKYKKVSSRKIDQVIEGKAKKIWRQKVQEAKENGNKIWDQFVYRLERIYITRNKCKLEFSTIPFSIRMSTKDFTEELIEKGEDYLPMATYSSVFIETIDGLFVFGEKSDKYATNRRYTYIGGVFNRPKKLNGSIDLFSAASNEVEEELGVKKTDIEKFRLLGAFRSESVNVGFVFYCRLKLSRGEIMKKFRKRSELELRNIFFSKRKDIRSIGENKIGKEPEMVDIFEQNNE